MHLTTPTTKNARPIPSMGNSGPKPVHRPKTNYHGSLNRPTGRIRLGLGRALRRLTWAATLIVMVLSGVGCGSDTRDRTGDGVSAVAASRDVAPSEADDPNPSTNDWGSGAGNRDPPADDSAVVGDWKPNATVERVVDGDTLIAEIGGRSESVRLIGIDTPESVARSRPVECYGLEASLRLQELLPPGTAVTLVRDVEGRDAYDRLLGYVVRSDDGLFINLELVASGYAATLNFPPNDHYADALARAESEAIAARRGLWGACGSPDVPVE